MKVFLTGGTGFIGGKVAELLRDRGDQVVALVRDRSAATSLTDIGCELLEGDLSQRAPLKAAISGVDAVIHCAAVYEVGIADDERARMWAANVEGTTNVLASARDADVKRAVYVSTCGVFGNTHGEVVDETYVHPGQGYTSTYEETKVLAHRAALELQADGLNLVIVQPGGVYGPGDHSALGEVISKFAKRQLPAILFPDLGMSLVHRDDVADGIVLALDKGQIGEAYVIGGQIETMRGLISTEARILGRRAPRFTIPAGLVKALNPLGRFVGPLLGTGPNLAELVSSGDGVTFWATSAKAERELGYRPRDLEDGLRETMAAEGLLK